MIESSIARRYAKALLEIAKDTSALESFLEELEQLREVVRQYPSVMETLGNSFLDLNARIRVAEELGLKLRQSREVLSFIKILVKKGRIRLLNHVVEAYRNYVYELGGKLEAVVTSAKPLQEASYQEIQKIISRITGKTIVIQPEIDPEVIGGLSVRVGGEIFDGTLRSSLERLGAGMEKLLF